MCLPNILLAFYMVITMAIVLFGGATTQYAKAEVKFTLLWGAVYVTLLVICSMALVVLNYLKNKKSIESKVTGTVSETISQKTSETVSKVTSEKTSDVVESTSETISENTSEITSESTSQNNI